MDQLHPWNSMKVVQKHYESLYSVNIYCIVVFLSSFDWFGNCNISNESANDVQTTLASIMHHPILAYNYRL